MKTIFGRLLCAVAAAAITVPALAQDKVRAAVGQRGNWDTLIITQGTEAGIFKRENVEVDITWTKGGAETLQAVITDSADVAIANGILGVIGAVSKGAPVRIVSSQMTGAPDIYWYVKADSPIKSMKDMTGRTMGYSRPGSSTNLVALALAEHFHVKPKLVSTGGIPDTRTQVMSGQIDAGWAVPHFNFDLVNEGKIRIIARGSDVPSLRGQTVRLLIANADALAKRRDAIVRFIKAYREAVDWMYADPAAVAMYAKKTGVAEDVVRQSMVQFQPKAALQSDEMKDLDGAMRDAVKLKFLDKPLSAEQIKDFIQIPPR